MKKQYETPLFDVTRVMFNEEIMTQSGGEGANGAYNNGEGGEGGWGSFGIDTSGDEPGAY